MRTLRNIFVSKGFSAAGERKRPVKNFNYTAADAASTFLFLFVYIVMCVLNCVC